MNHRLPESSPGEGTRRSSCGLTNQGMPADSGAEGHPRCMFCKNNREGPNPTCRCLSLRLENNPFPVSSQLSREPIVREGFVWGGGGCSGRRPLRRELVKEGLLESDHTPPSTPPPCTSGGGAGAERGPHRVLKLWFPLTLAGRCQLPFPKASPSTGPGLAGLWRRG